MQDQDNTNNTHSSDEDSLVEMSSDNSIKNRRIIMEQRQKNVDKFRKYLHDSGISLAFKIIMTEII